MENKNKRQLPAIKDILSGDIEVYKKQSQLNVLLNQEPNPKWIKEHPFAKNVKYITIGRIEFLLTSIFDFWNVEIKSTQLIANSVIITIRLHYKSLIDGSMQFQDGIGAAPLQTDKGAGATDFNSIKSDAVMKAAPSAESFAIKDAAQKLGKLFGKDLNRVDNIVYDALLNKHEYTNIEDSEDDKIPDKVYEEGVLFNEENK